MSKKPSPPSVVAGNEEYHFSAQIGHLLRRAYQRHVAIFQAAIPDSDLTAAQFVTLCAVKEQQSCSLNDIVKATAIDQATIRGVVERLKARSLIEVLPDPLDGRKLLVRTTPEGLALIDQTVPFARQVSEQTYGGLNPAERVAIVYLLRAMTRAEDN
ncbi:transcriptional regulator, MarR family [Burkholderia sp. D7]|nr:transcriptional regulator, MarR family [Burkholderia sp. D7]